MVMPGGPVMESAIQPPKLEIDIPWLAGQNPTIPYRTRPSQVTGVVAGFM